MMRAATRIHKRSCESTSLYRLFDLIIRMLDGCPYYNIIYLCCAALETLFSKYILYVTYCCFGPAVVPCIFCRLCHNLYRVLQYKYM